MRFVVAPKLRSLGRLQCRKSFAFGREWNNVWYALKQVRPIFVDDSSEIVVVTVYVYYLSGDLP